MHFLISLYLALTLFSNNVSFGEAGGGSSPKCPSGQSGPPGQCTCIVAKGCECPAPINGDDDGFPCPNFPGVNGKCGCPKAPDIAGDAFPSIPKGTVGKYHPFLIVTNYIPQKRNLLALDIDPSNCESKDYELVFVGVGQHLVVAALSECVGTDEICNCPSQLVFHQASITEENVVQSVKKEVLEVSEDELAQHDMLSLGSFSLGKIFESFNNANSEDKVYNMVANNCASLLIEMALQLEIDPTDKSITTYAANHLFNNANSYMVDGLSQNDFRLALEDNSNAKDDQYTYIEDFVKTYIDEQV